MTERHSEGRTPRRNPAGRPQPVTVAWLRIVCAVVLMLPASACENMMLKKVSRDSLQSFNSSKTTLTSLDTAVAAPSSQNPNPLLAAIETQLRKVKPDIENTRLVSLVPALSWGDTMSYAVIAKGRGPHRGWKKLPDIGEIYGVFWVDSTLTRPSAPIDVFPSRALDDYDVWLQRAWGDVVVVCAEGRAYGDERMRREIEAEPDSGKVRRIEIDTGYPPQKVDAPCGSSGPKGD